MRFEDLIAWQRARELTNAVYQMCREKPLASDFGLKDQIQRAAVSVMSNLAEGFERIHHGEKTQLYNVAKASSGEVKSLCYVIMDNELAPADLVNHVHALSEKTSALIQGLMKSKRVHKS